MGEARNALEMILDTDVLIDVLRGYPEAVTFLTQSSTGKEGLGISVVTLSEILSGIRDKEGPSVESLLRILTPLPVTEPIARTAGQYRRQYFRSHGLLTPDALIAATTRHHGGLLVTLNRKHYPMKDIEIRVPYSKA